jgi:hypothetical protein
MEEMLVDDSRVRFPNLEAGVRLVEVDPEQYAAQQAYAARQVRDVPVSVVDDPSSPVGMLDVTSGVLTSKWGRVKLSTKDREALGEIVLRTLKETWLRELTLVRMAMAPTLEESEAPKRKRRGTKTVSASARTTDPEPTQEG